MKKIMFLSVAAALMMTACNGQSGKNESEADSLALSGDSAVEAVEEVTEEPVAEEAVLNADLLGKWHNNTDPVIEMMVSDKYGTYDDNKGYGFVRASNEYFEYDFNLVFTEVTADGDKIRVKYDKMEAQFTGDPDDPDGEGTWETKKVGTGELTLVPAGAKKLKIESTEKRINKATLYK